MSFTIQGIKGIDLNYKLPLGQDLNSPLYGKVVYYLITLEQSVFDFYHQNELIVSC
jgi:hypothetical protein